MKKKSHWMITNYALCGRLSPFRRFLIKLGCVMPDVLLYTFKRGHYYNATKGKVLREIDKLIFSNKPTALACYKFGYQLHYVEDYFTYPHHFPYWQNRKRHAEYELSLQKEIPSFLSPYVFAPVSEQGRPSSFIERYHALYLMRAGDVITDLSFMIPLVEYLVKLFCEDVFFD